MEYENDQTKEVHSPQIMSSFGLFGIDVHVLPSAKAVSHILDFGGFFVIVWVFADHLRYLSRILRMGQMSRIICVIRPIRDFSFCVNLWAISSLSLRQ